MIFRLAIMRSKSAGSHLIILHGCLRHCITKYKSTRKRNDTVGEREVVSLRVYCVFCNWTLQSYIPARVWLCRFMQRKICVWMFRINWVMKSCVLVCRRGSLLLIWEKSCNYTCLWIFSNFFKWVVYSNDVRYTVYRCRCTMDLLVGLWSIPFAVIFQIACVSGFSGTGSVSISMCPFDEGDGRVA